MKKMSLSVEEMYEAIATQEDNKKLQQKMEYCYKRFEKIDRIRDYKLRRIRQEEHWNARDSIIKEHYIETISRKKGIQYIAMKDFKDWFIEFEEEDEIEKELNEKNKTIEEKDKTIEEQKNEIAELKRIYGIK